MKKIVSLGIMSTLSVFLFAGDCWKITSPDDKYMCESRYENKNSCWKIKDLDQQNYCKATAENKKTCWKIKNNNLKYKCQSETGQ